MGRAEVSRATARSQTGAGMGCSPSNGLVFTEREREREREPAREAYEQRRAGVGRKRDSGDGCDLGVHTDGPKEGPREG